MRPSRPAAVFTRIPNYRHACRCWFKTDRTRAIDRYIDYFGAADPFPGRTSHACDRGAPIVASWTLAPSAP